MTQAHPVPDMHASGSLAVERMTRGAVALLGARQGTNQIQLRAGIDHPADAAQNSVHLPKGAKTIDVYGLQVGGLRQQFFVGHETPRHRQVSNYDRTTTRLHQDSVGHPTNVIGRSEGLT